MAPVTYLRPAAGSRGRTSSRRGDARAGRRRPGRYVALAVVLVLVLVLVGGAIALRTSKPSLTSDPVALAKLTLPLGGATIQSVSVVTGPHSAAVPVTVRDNRLWPTRKIRAGQTVTIQVVVKRAASVAWLTGSTQHMWLTLAAPTAPLKAQYVTVSGTGPLRVSFAGPVTSFAYGAQPNRLRAQTLTAPQSVVTVPRQGAAGSVYVAGAPRTWETAAPQLLSWFPAGTAAAVVASPNPGTTLGATTPITLSFSKHVSQVLGHAMPPVSPITQGTWHAIDSHRIVFRPEGYGYGLGAKVKIGLPSNVGIVGGAAQWTVPPGSTLRLQQLLAQLKYLPLNFNGPTVAPNPQAQEAAAVKPPQGGFDWAYGNVPSMLRSMWAPGASGEMTKAALMMFQNDHGLTADGDAGPSTWKALMGAAIGGRPSSFGYTFVSVDKSAQRLSLWHNGHTVLSTPVNTGIAQAPTASGTFAVYEHLRVTTMSGTNPDGSHYNDPGIQYVSYFNGGDALHAFTRAQYGFPQSLGCVEMALDPAGQVWPYTPIGTLVNVA